MRSRGGRKKYKILKPSTAKIKPKKQAWKSKTYNRQGYDGHVSEEA